MQLLQSTTPHRPGQSDGAAVRPGPSVAVVGAGVMGLAAALQALKLGYRVTVYEADKVPGGMAAHLDFGGLSIERFYHFVCKADRDTFELLAELGLAQHLRWVPTSMGYFIGNRLHDWGNPLALLKFPLLGPIEKLRYGLMMFLAIKRRQPGDLELTTARDWLVRWCGERTFDLMWRPLFDLKFYQFAGDVSAAWMWTRIKRVGTSRRSLLQEELGYIAGGSQTLIDALVAAIRQRGGTIETGVGVRRVIVRDGRVAGVETSDGMVPHEAVLSTVPTPYVSGMIPDLPNASKAAYDGIANIGVVCVLLKLKRSVTPHFWVNVSDRSMAIPGFVEFSNLRPAPHAIVYVPYYMPGSNAKFQRSDDAFIAESFSYLRRINPQLASDDLIEGRVGRLRHAQPVCTTGFKTRLPSVVTPIAGLQIADTCFYYPEDRGISESVRLGKLMAHNLAVTAERSP